MLGQFFKYSNESICLVIQYFHVHHTSNQEEKKHKEKEKCDRKS